MALSTATVTMNLADMLGVDFEVRRTKVWVDTNVPDDTVIDTVGNAIRLGSGTVTLADDGTATAVVWVPGTGSNPATWQTSIHVDYGDPGTRSRKVRDFGPFTITADADLADLVEEQEVPPTYLSIVTAELDGYVDDAEFAANQAETARDQARDYRDEARDISNIATPDGLVKTLIVDPDSETGIALNTGFIAGGPETSTLRASAHPDGLMGAMDGLAAWLTDPFGTGTVTLVGDSTMHDPGLAFDSKRAFYQHASMIAALFPGIRVRYFRHDGALGGQMFFRPPTVISTGGGAVEPYWDCPGTTNYAPWIIVPRARQGNDIDVTAKVEPTAWSSALQHTLYSIDSDASSNKDVWQFSIQADGTLRLRWWTAAGVSTGSTAIGTVAVTPPVSGPLFIRAKCVTDLAAIGAGTGWSCTFQTSSDGFTWTTLETLTSATAKPVRKVARAKVFFGYGGGSSNNFVGKLYEAYLRAFVDGPVIAPYCVSAWQSTTVPIYKSQMQGGPQLDFWNGSWPGRCISDTFDNPNYFPWLIMPGNNLTHYVNTNTNDAGLRSASLRESIYVPPGTDPLDVDTRLTGWASMLAHHRAVVPGARVVAINGVPSITSSATMPEKVVRAVQMANWLPTLGVAVLDTWRAWLEDGRAWSALNTGEHHPIDDGTLNADNPVRREAQILTNAVMASPFATQNPSSLVRA